jgi:hypothetical protein
MYAHVQALAQLVDMRQARPVATVPNVSGDTLARILDYIYTDETALTATNAVDVHVAAGALGLARLQHHATVFIRDHVTTDNVLPMLQAAHRAKAADLEKFFFKFFQTKERYGRVHRWALGELCVCV